MKCTCYIGFTSPSSNANRLEAVHRVCAVDERPSDKDYNTADGDDYTPGLSGSRLAQVIADKLSTKSNMYYEELSLFLT